MDFWIKESVPAGNGIRLTRKTQMNITQTFYDKMAARYDKLFLDWQSTTHEQAMILDKLFAERGFDRTARILDCACGIGTQSIGLAALGGKDPLDGISIYDGGSYWHFVSFGQTELYEKESDTPDVSGYGYELTFKLKKDKYEDEEAEIRNICGILQMIARLTFTKGEIFRPFEFLYTGQTTGIDAKQKSNLTGFITVKDSTVETINTPNGKVEFLELIGMTDAELKTLSNVGSVMEIYDKLGSDITDYHRESIV